MIGFLGIDPILEPTASELYVIVVPRYAIRTDILVSTKHGQDELVIEDGNPLKIVLPSDLMGCSDGRLYFIHDQLVTVASHQILYKKNQNKEKKIHIIKDIQTALICTEIDKHCINS